MQIGAHREPEKADRGDRDHRVAEGADEAEEPADGSLAPLAREVRRRHGSCQLGAGKQDQAVSEAGDDRDDDHGRTEHGEQLTENQQDAVGNRETKGDRRHMADLENLLQTDLLDFLFT